MATRAWRGALPGPGLSMDAAVQAALQRWPNVPAVCGWLSLSARGQWRLHPLGDATPERPGESITNPQLLAYIGRNYLAETDGRWYFQNGPQRVYVTLALAPWVLRLGNDGRHLVTHTGLPVTAVHGWWLHANGTLYLQTEHGPGVLLDRDLATALGALTNTAGVPLETPLLNDPDAPLHHTLAAWHGEPLHWALTPAGSAPLHLLASGTTEAVLGFVRQPCCQPPNAPLLQNR